MKTRREVLTSSARILSAAGLASLAAPPAMAQVGDALNLLGKAWSKKDTITKGATALRKGFTELTDQEEYFIGRAVAARILADYKPVKDEGKNRYINSVGQTLARYSSRPETFAGYHFMLVQSSEVNAFAAPGGFVLISTGLYGKITTEEQLAAVLAHEIAHVTLKHGLGAIKSANLTQAFTIIGTEAAMKYAPAQLATLTSAFEGSIDDVVNKMVVSGYSRGQEYDADSEALKIAYRAGYDPAGLVQFLQSLAGFARHGGGVGFYKTHPPADERAEKAARIIKKEKLTGAEEKARTQRFAKYALS